MSVKPKEWKVSERSEQDQLPRASQARGDAKVILDLVVVGYCHCL